MRNSCSHPTHGSKSEAKPVRVPRRSSDDGPKGSVVDIWKLGYPQGARGFASQARAWFAVVMSPLEPQRIRRKLQLANGGQR